MGHRGDGSGTEKDRGGEVDALHKESKEGFVWEEEVSDPPAKAKWLTIGKVRGCLDCNQQPPHQMFGVDRAGGRVFGSEPKFHSRANILVTP
jgi:hypothetical protein